MHNVVTTLSCLIVWVFLRPQTLGGKKWEPRFRIYKAVHSVTPPHSIPEMPCIGSIIHKVVIEQRITIATFAQLIGLKRPNVYRIFSSMSLDTALLLRISKVLHYDFFKHYSQILEE